MRVFSRSREFSSSEPMDIGIPTDKAPNKRWVHCQLSTDAQFQEDIIAFSDAYLMCSTLVVSSVLDTKSSETSALTGKTLEKDKAPGGSGGPGPLLVASPPEQGDAEDSVLDSKPKKGIIFEIRSEDGFHIRCESIEGKQKYNNGKRIIFFSPQQLAHFERSRRSGNSVCVSQNRIHQQLDRIVL